MIFVTVGTNMPFDRLIQTVDSWVGATGRTDVFAQVGEGGWEPKHMPFSQFLEPPEFTHRFSSASLIIAHAGMGTILSALGYGKPILVMPRRASLGEQRNEHQLATAKHLSQMAKISVAFDEHELRQRLGALESLQAGVKVAASASPELCSAIRNFVLRSKPYRVR
ncbi:glycosyltransferase [Verrucomicrobiota bacterium sgz303538]